MQLTAHLSSSVRRNRKEENISWLEVVVVAFPRFLVFVLQGQEKDLAGADAKSKSLGNADAKALSFMSRRIP
jgi:hypothetical protein